MAYSSDGMRTFRFEQDFALPRPINEVFAFFSDATNLQRLTPPWLNFEVLSPKPIKMETGTLLDYKLKIRGIPIRWQSAITVWDPPHRFVDVQTKGPYRQWIHEHRFVEEGGGTRVWDQVDYAVPGGWFINRLFVKKDIERIFAYRRQVLQRLFAAP